MRPVPFGPQTKTSLAAMKPYTVHIRQLVTWQSVSGARIDAAFFSAITVFIVESGEAKRMMQITVAKMTTADERAADVAPPRMSFVHSSSAADAPPTRVYCTAFSWLLPFISGMNETNESSATIAPGTFDATMYGFDTDSP